MDTSKQTVSKASNLRDQSSSTISSASSSSSSNNLAKNFHLRGENNYTQFYINKESLRAGHYPYTSSSPTLNAAPSRSNTKTGHNSYLRKKSNFNWQLNEFNDYYL